MQDVWQRVWDLLSIRDLARLGGVSRQWRSAAAVRTVAKRAEAAALVMAAESNVDRHLTAAQWVFRAAARTLRGLDAITGEPLGASFLRWSGGFEGKTTGTVFIDWRGSLEQRLYPDKTLSLEFTCRCRHPVHPSCRKRTFGMYLKPAESEDGLYCPEKPFRVRFEFEPHTPEESAWLQGLLLALSHGTLVSLRRRNRLPRLRGPLARCVELSVDWWNMEGLRNFKSIGRVVRKMPRGLENTWPPTSGECYLPLMLLKRARRPHKPHTMRFKRPVS